MSIPAPVVPVIRLLRDGLPQVLGGNLTGIYVYGSLMGPDFVSIRSDVDCIIVTNVAIEEERFRSLRDWLAEERRSEPWLDRLQASFLVRDRVLEDDPAACLYQFGELTRSGSDGNPLIWMDYLHRGHRVYGAKVETFLPRITEHDLDRALVREVGYLRDEMVVTETSKWRGDLTYRAYAVLTLCRILFTGATGSLASKAEAADWALRQAPEEFHDLITRALRVSQARGLERLSRDEIARFIGYVQSVQE